MKAVNLIAAMFGGLPNLLPAKYSEGKREKNPNTAESQYLLARAEEKRERRGVVLSANARKVANFFAPSYVYGVGILKQVESNATRPAASSGFAFGQGEYNTPDYFGARAKVRTAVDAHNAAQPVVEKSPLNKPTKNVYRKMRAVELSKQHLARQPKVKNNGRLA